MRESTDDGPRSPGSVEAEIVGIAGRIGRELVDEISIELAGLVDFMSALSDMPTLAAVTGNLGSLTYRSCEVYKTLTLLGHATWTAACKCRAGTLPTATGVEPLGHAFALVQVHLGVLAEGIDRLVASTTAFLGPDLDLIARQPEIMRHDALHASIRLISDPMQRLFARIEEIGLAATLLALTDPSQALPAPARALYADDRRPRDWSTVHDEIGACIETASGKPVPGIGMASAFSPAPVMHPRPNDDGEPVLVASPTRQTSAISWIDRTRSAVFVPDGTTPGIINAVPVARWTSPPATTAQWNALDLLMPALEEPPLPASTLAVASGVVVIEPDGRLWLVSPTNRFGGHGTTFPKGKRDDQALSLQANAVKECFEESGLKVRITGVLGDFERTTSVTRLYLGERVGGDPTGMGWESQAVRLAPPAHWSRLLTNPNDRPVLAAIHAAFKRAR